MTSMYLSEEQLDNYAELAITAEHDGIKVDPAVVTALVDEVRRRKFQVSFLLRQIAKKDARSGDGDRAVREFLGSEQQATEAFVPRTERSYWVSIADALNAAHFVGMSVGIDLDGTLTDHNAWSVVWDRAAERWTVAGYDDEPASA